MTIFRSVGRALAKRAPAIFAGLGVASVVTTVIATVKGTEKAHEKLEQLPDTADAKEKIKAVVPCYISTAVCGVAAISMFGAQYLNQRNTRNKCASLMVRMQDNVDRCFTGVTSAAGSVMGDAIMKAAFSTKSTEPPVPPDKLYWFYDQWSDRWFKAEYADVVAGEYDANQHMAETGRVSLSDFYYFCNVPSQASDEDKGWDCENLFDEFELVWIPFYNRRATDAEHGQHFIISCGIEPQLFSYIDHLWDSKSGCVVLERSC